MINLKKIFNFKKKKILITGATGKVGRLLSITFASCGADLILTDLSNDKLLILKKNIQRKYNVNIQIYTCNFLFEEERDLLIKNILNKNNNLEVIINNAAMLSGINKSVEWIGKAEEQSLEFWNKSLEINLTSVFDICKNFKKLLIKKKKSCILNIGSIYGHVAPNFNIYKGLRMGNPASYAASKAGLSQLTKWMSTEFAPNVRVNQISIGGIFRNQKKSFVQRYNKMTPLNKMATENDVVKAALFLTSDLSEYITGQVLIVDGGYTVW